MEFISKDLVLALSDSKFQIITPATNVMTKTEDQGSKRSHDAALLVTSCFLKIEKEKQHF